MVVQAHLCDTPANPGCFPCQGVGSMFDSWLIVSTLFVLFISSMFSSISFRLMVLSKLFASVITVFIESRDCKVLSPGNLRCS